MLIRRQPVDMYIFHSDILWILTQVQRYFQRLPLIEIHGTGLESYLEKGTKVICKDHFEDQGSGLGKKLWETAVTRFKIIKSSVLARI